VSITPAECKVARKLLGWSQPKLAEMLFVGGGTIGQFERRQRHWRSLNLHKLRAVFEAAGVEFVEGTEPKLTVKPTVTRATWDTPPKR
jgi:transcriptional regulator with XRE-family HTH domain